MKTLRLTAPALAALVRHRNAAQRIRAKLEDYAADPSSFAASVKSLKGSPAKRLRIGAFRAIFEEDETTITVTRIAPRGSVYD